MVNYTHLTSEKTWHKGMLPIFCFSFKQVTEYELGIDLSKYKEDIKLIFYKRQAHRMVKEGLDPEEVLQEVYKGVLIRNRGKCPYDPRKSALSTYIVLVMDCIIMNIVSKHRKEKSRFEYGSESDVASSCNTSFEKDYTDNLMFVEIRKSFKKDQLTVFDAIMDGFKMAHIARTLGWEARKVSKLKKEIQQIVATKMNRGDLLTC
jgi:hypothetical protein